MKKILFVHGFGVMKDSRGMFLELADSVAASGYEPILVDLNEVDEAGDLMVSPFSEQVARVREVYDRESAGAEISLIAHSQGCLITALADLPDIEKSILLAPPTDSGSEAMIAYFSARANTEVDKEGISRIVRSDKTATLVPAAYWSEKDALDAKALYQAYVAAHATEVVRATEDEVISNEGMETVFAGISIHDIAADHNFTGESRSVLLQLVPTLLK